MHRQADHPVSGSFDAHERRPGRLGPFPAQRANRPVGAGPFQPLPGRVDGLSQRAELPDAVPQGASQEHAGVPARGKIRAMRRFGPLSLIFTCLVVPVSARHDVSVCGTTRETPNESLFLHRQSLRARAARLLRPMAASAAAPPSANLDMGDIAVIEDAGGVVERLNQFNLDSNTLTFTPTAPKAAQYRYSVAPQGYDSGAASQGTPLAALADDTPAWPARPPGSR